jgi:predicted nucleotidyltransferase
MSIPLSDEFLQTIVTEIDSDEITAVILAGSHVHGTATPYSDVDFARFVRPPAQGKKKRYFYREGHLISVATWTFDVIEESMTRPELAIWRVPGLREARILLDKEGTFAAFQQKLRDFRWETLQEQANAWASEELVLFGEFAHKMLGGLLNHDETTMAYATQDLLWTLPEVVAVQRGILIEGSNRYYTQIQEAVGKDSAWTHFHRLALCLEPGPADLTPAVARGIATLLLYEETAQILRDVLKPQDREVIEQTLHVIAEASLPASLR